jgi:hypothetical protein|tara:strand:- start:907 stop:1272 length:366 start_codon:yes stop_codon:yes gene_type:complete
LKRAHGYRSNFELDIANQLVKNKVPFSYEKINFNYVRHSTYTPDFYLKDQDFYIEVKGLFTAQDRGKHLLIKKQHPDLDLRFLFMKASNKLYKGSKTTYSGWCERYDIKWCQSFIPKEWIE